ncbi:hypothetical protein [Glycomyces sp. NPDC047010]|uniref:hypothetical protein n=1 Tax=Glycomyces sp. NPDC047010 TaxID=3155023 RepID=UPI0033F62871
MTDTTSTASGDDDAIEAEETQRVHDAITAFREGLATLKATEGAECNYQWQALLAACVDGQVALTEFAGGIAAFIGDCWPTAIGNAADEAVAQSRRGAHALAAVYGQCTHVPQVEDLGVPVNAAEAA